MNFETRHKMTLLRSMSKEMLLNHIQCLYRDADQILEALTYIEEDIALIKKGDALHVHDNP